MQRVADHRWIAEGELLGPAGTGDAVGDRDLYRRAVGTREHVGRGVQRLDGEVLGGLEDDRLVTGRTRRSDLGPPDREVQGLLGGPHKAKAQEGPRRDGGVQTDIEQLQQRHVQLLGQPVEPEDRLLGHPREQLDEGDPRVGDVVLGPLRAGLRDPRPRLADEILKGTIVEVDLGQRRHHSTSSAGTT